MKESLEPRPRKQNKSEANYYLFKKIHTCNRGDHECVFSPFVKAHVHSFLSDICFGGMHQK